MLLVTINNLSKEFKGEVLLKDVNFTINDKDRIALIGPNGCGKTTLLKMLIEELEIDKGSISIAKNVRIGYLSQDVISSLNNSLYEEAINVFSSLIAKEKELEELTHKLANEPNNEKLIEEYGKKQTIFSSLGGYDYHYKIEMMLSKFGFKKSDYTRLITTFSGGERTKIAFIKLLLIEPNLLILDEPTNHLDLITIEWLETYLKTYHGALLFVSHDRYFIDALASSIMEIENKTLFYYKGDYETFNRVKKEKYENQLRHYINQQHEMERMKKFIEFYRYKPRFVNRVHDREKKLEHLNKIDKPYQEKSSINISFKGETLKGKKILEITNLTIGYDYIPLIKDINFTLYGQNKIAIMGKNGSGKSTLLKVLMEEEKSLSGSVTFKRQVRIGYIDQHHLELNTDETLLDNMLNAFPTLGEKNLRNHLGKFSFVNDDYQKKLSSLSGGEKMRFVLAKIILRNYDILFLDEPTNHLDLMTKTALINALKEYQGSIIFVSHDRFFVDELATHVLYLTNMKTFFIEGSYQDLMNKYQSQIEECELLDEATEKTSSIDIKKTSQIESKELAEKITALEARIKKLKEDQFLEENYMNYENNLKIEKELKILESELQDLESKYLL